jgi:hypothetical protein
MSERGPASGTNKSNTASAKSDDDTSSPGRRASKDNTARLVRCES